MSTVKENQGLDVNEEVNANKTEDAEHEEPGQMASFDTGACASHQVESDHFPVLHNVSNYSVVKVHTSDWFIESEIPYFKDPYLEKQVKVQLRQLIPEGRMADIHRKLLDKISNFMVVGSSENNHFLEQMKPYGVLTQKSDSLLDCLKDLEKNNSLSPGNYETLKSIATKSGNQRLLHFIAEAEKEINKIKSPDAGDLLYKEIEWFTETEEIHLKMLQSDLILYYRSTCKDIQISPLFDKNAPNFLEVHVSPTLTCVDLAADRKRNKLFQTTSVETYHSIFVKNHQVCQHIYVLSPAGCGKTSFAKRMALTWCQAHQPIKSDYYWFNEVDIDEMEEFKYLFFIYLREADECECVIDIMIQKQLLQGLANPSVYSKLDFLQKLLSSEKCLIIMDGLDEWNHPQDGHCSRTDRRIPHSRAWPLCTILTTTQPWKLDVAALKHHEIDQKLELNGLDDELSEQLMYRVIEQMNKFYSKKKMPWLFRLELDDKNLTDMSKIPVVLMSFLTLWFHDEPLWRSHCKIYSNMIELFLKKYFIKKGMVVEIGHAIVGDTSAPLCFQDNVQCKAHMDLLSKLGELAFFALFSNNQESSLIFDLKVARKFMSPEDLEMIREAGILSQDKVIGKMSKRQSNVWFLHKTFQEFFVALHIALNPDKQKELEDKIMQICSSVEKILEMSQIFMFISGLCPQVMLDLCEPLRCVLLADSQAAKYRSSCEQMCPDVTWTFIEMQMMTLNCFKESCLNDHKNVYLSLTDVFIDGDDLVRMGCPWSEDLKSLIVRSPLRSLDIRNEHRSEKLEDIANSVTLFNTIQKLFLMHVPGTVVVQLFFEHEHSLNAISEVWQSLQYITLSHVENMSGDILCLLVDCVVQLPKSVHVSVMSCYIDPMSGDWRKYICSHPQIVVDNDEDINELFQFHTICVQTLGSGIGT